VCNALETPDLQRLSDVAVRRHVEKGRVFIEEGMPASDFFNVTSGTVKLFKTLPDGRQQITGFAGTGHFLGLAVSQTYSFSAQAIETVEVCRFSRPKLRTLLHDFPALEQRLLETACNELVEAQEQMLLLGRKNARERVASFLMARLDDAITCDGATDTVELPMTRAEIADYLGLTIETISRTISKLKAENKITTPNRDTVVILEPQWLASVAAGQDTVECLA
jgi:CRP/FNR family transcriptional regulator